jgi:hypothetical protein
MSRPLLSLKMASLSLLAAGTLFLNSCKDEPAGPGEDPVLTKYDFSPEMSYGGQTVRLLLIDTLMTRIKQLDDAGAGPVSAADLNAIFDNTSGLFSDIATGKKLSDKVSGFVNPMMVEQLRAWFDSLATRSAAYAGSPDAVNTSDGIYLVEAVEKSLMGSVLYAQAINYLRHEVPVADNSTSNPGEGTEMAHNWDEAFGYFGASRNYVELKTAAERRSMFDWNNDGKIDPASERNFYFARYTATADTQHFTYTTKGTLGLGDEIVKNFIAGRQAIAKNNHEKVATATTAILAAWDKVIAANAVRYGGIVKTQIAASKAYNGQWAELKGFVDMTQYNNLSLLSPAKYAELKALIGEKPADVTAEKIDQIISALKTAYNF